MYAIVELSGKQFRVEPGTELKVPKQSGNVGDKVSVDRVLYFDNDKEKLIGTPYVKDMVINGKITSHGRDKKIIVFKMKRRKRYRRKHSHRQEFSLVTFDTLSTPKKKVAKKTASPKKATTAKAKPTTKSTVAKKPAAKTTAVKSKAKSTTKKKD